MAHPPNIFSLFSKVSSIGGRTYRDGCPRYTKRTCIRLGMRLQVLSWSRRIFVYLACPSQICFPTPDLLVYPVSQAHNNLLPRNAWQSDPIRQNCECGKLPPIDVALSGPDHYFFPHPLIKTTVSLSEVYQNLLHENLLGSSFIIVYSLFLSLLFAFLKNYREQREM